MVGILCSFCLSHVGVKRSVYLDIVERSMVTMPANVF